MSFLKNNSKEPEYTEEQLRGTFIPIQGRKPRYTNQNSSTGLPNFGMSPWGLVTAVLDTLNIVPVLVDGVTIGFNTSGQLHVLPNGIGVTQLNLGTGTNQVNASSIPIIDTASNFTATNIETALAELFSLIGAGGSAEVIVNSGALSGAAPVDAKLGVDTLTGTLYYVDGSGNWQAATTDNIYTGDNTISSNRTVTNNLGLLFTGTGDNTLLSVNGTINAQVKTTTTTAQSESAVTATNSTGTIGFKAKAGTNTRLEVITPKVLAGTVTAGEVFVVTDPITGEGEWSPTSGNITVSIVEFFAKEFLQIRDGLVPFVVPASYNGYTLAKIESKVITYTDIVTFDLEVNGSTVATITNTGTLTTNTISGALATGDVITVSPTAVGLTPSRGLVVILTFIP